MLKKGTKERKRVYAAKRFARGAMVCPSCQYVLDESATACPKCSFSGQVSVEKFPFPPPPLGPILDPNKLLSKDEQASILKKVGKMEKKLPQLRFLNCLVPLGSEVDLREFGFWLFNAGELKGGENEKSFAVLFLVDPQGGALSVTTGYGLEPFVMDTEWVALCEDARDLFYRQKYGPAVEVFLDGAYELLMNRALEVLKEAKK